MDNRHDPGVRDEVLQYLEDHLHRTQHETNTWTQAGHEMETVAQKVKELTDRLQQSEISSQIAGERSQQLQVCLEQAEARNAELSHSLQQQHEGNEKGRLQIRQLLTDLSSERASFESTLSEARHEKAALEASVRGLQQQLVDRDELIRKVRAEAELSRAQLTRELEQAGKQHLAIRQEAQKLKQGAVNAQLEMLSFSEGITEAEARERELRENQLQLEHKLAAEKQINMTLTGRIEQLELECEAQGAQQKQMRHKDRFIRHVLSDKKNSSATLEQTRHELARLQATNSALTAELEQEKSSGREQMVLLSTLDSRVRELQLRVLTAEEQAIGFRELADAASKRESDAVDQTALEKKRAEEACVQRDTMLAQHQRLVSECDRGQVMVQTAGARVEELEVKLAESAAQQVGSQQRLQQAYEQQTQMTQELHTAQERAEEHIQWSTALIEAVASDRLLFAAELEQQSVESVEAQALERQSGQHAMHTTSHLKHQQHTVLALVEKQLEQIRADTLSAPAKAPTSAGGGRREPCGTDAEWLLNGICVLWAKKAQVSLTQWLALCNNQLQDLMAKQSGQEALTTAALNSTKAIESALVNEVEYADNNQPLEQQLHCATWALEQVLRELAILVVYNAELGSHVLTTEAAQSRPMKSESQENIGLLSVIADLELALEASQQELAAIKTTLHDTETAYKSQLQSKEQSLENLRASTQQRHSDEDQQSLLRERELNRALEQEKQRSARAEQELDQVRAAREEAGLQIQKLETERDELVENVHTLATDLEQREEDRPVSDESTIVALERAKADQETLILLVKQFEQELNDLRAHNTALTSCHDGFCSTLANFGQAVSRNRNKVGKNLDSMGPQPQSASASQATLCTMIEACSESLLSTISKLGTMLEGHETPSDEHTEALTQEVAIALEYIARLEVNVTNPRGTHQNPTGRRSKPSEKLGADADNAFERIDTNADGVITREEFAAQVTITA